MTTPLALDQLQARELAPGFHARLLHTDRVTIARVEIDAGSALPEHAHPHEQVTMLLEGDFELTVGGTPHRLAPGASFVIPGGVRHSARAFTRCRVIDVFQPARDDYR